MAPNSPDFEKIILPIAKFLLLVLVSSQKYRKILFFSYFHISTCGPIWLNHFTDDSHLGYITELEKETLTQSVYGQHPSFLRKKKVNQPNGRQGKKKKMQAILLHWLQERHAPWFNVLGACAGYQHW